MNVFDLRDRLVSDYGRYVRSFIRILDERIGAVVEKELAEGLLWPEPLIQLNPAFASGESIDDLVKSGLLHEECGQIFRVQKDRSPAGKPLQLHRHQADAVKTARTGASYVLTTGTGSGKSLAYIIPIVDLALRERPRRGIKAIVVYPMNALANSQAGELGKFLCAGYPEGKPPVTFARYTGQESDEKKQKIIADPPDILLTNYAMLELFLIRPEERALIQAAKGLRFLVLDEMHTYRGRQGADVAMLVRRAREAFEATRLQCIGTSATLATEGTYDEQREAIATVASALFGAQVSPQNVIGETLRRITPERGVEDPSFVIDLKERLSDQDRTIPFDYDGFVRDPLSIWIESTFGITAEPGTTRLTRSEPRSIRGDHGAARALGALTGLTEDRCFAAIQKHLLHSYICEPLPGTERPIFAFRLHQFISRGDSVYASIEPESLRSITVHGQHYVPGSERKRLLYPVVFCRECGQEYYAVVRREGPEGGGQSYRATELSNRLDEDEATGYLYVSATEPWPVEAQAIIERLPEDWIQEHKSGRRVRSDWRKHLPRIVRVLPDGREDATGIEAAFVPASFRFCLRCGVVYGGRQKKAFPKLATLATEGRATATTVLSLSIIRSLKGNADLPAEARKLLSFTDNRQDASLQAGHFNDFIEVGLLRSALLRGCRAAGPEGLSHDLLVQKVFDALNLDLAFYSENTDLKYGQLDQTNKALRSVLGYRLYRDLERGWRITSPNLEQCGLLEIRYQSLEDLAKADEEWRSFHPALATASAETRVEIGKALLDFLRRELAIKVDYLRSDYQERIQQQSSLLLKAPWALDENEKMETWSIAFPRPARAKDYGGHTYISPRGGFGAYLRRRLRPPQLSLEETGTVIQQLLGALRIAGLVGEVQKPRDAEDVPGYQVNAAAMIWVAGDGTKAFHDPIRIPRPPATGGRTNPFFIEFYSDIAKDGAGLEAREHTAAVPYEKREDRERRFSDATLPILYCSPTMELGVDIKDLNVVNMRNIPPTPANYAQRSGRAGRGGQPALVFSYCSTFSGHDQYFFRRPERMVGGQVTPPRIEIANEDLVRAHVHAIWLSAAGLSLGKSLKDVLDLQGANPSLAFAESVAADVEKTTARQAAYERARRVLDTVIADLRASDWYTDEWLNEVIRQVGRQLDAACDRWRGLYRAALAQRERAHAIISDASRSAEDKNRARALRFEAESQMALLTEAQRAVEADFYSYRYFASEGFLPGYSFPRLPLSAYIPGRRERGKRDEFLSRPRFLAISEFGPRSIIYHEGAQYRIEKAILPVGRDDENLLTTSAKLCGACGYLHPVSPAANPDVCDRCGAALGTPLASLFKLQNVVTKRVDRISSDEEERRRIGFEVISSVRFAEIGGRPSFRSAAATLDGAPLLSLAYGQAATIWRLNRGWKQRADPERLGFLLDADRGDWATNKKVEEDAQDEASTRRWERVVPYVEDRRNCLLLQPAGEFTEGEMASLQAAVKKAIQVEYQLEESELAAEPLPTSKERRLLLFYEAAEGGAGVLRRILDDPRALARIARQALTLCHYDAETGADLGKDPRAREACEAACYDCLMSYGNQYDHRLVDRRAIRDFLLRLAKAEVASSPTPKSRAEHLEELSRVCGSGLERQWLRHVADKDLRLPSRAQKLIETCQTRPDFLYEDECTAIYVDGPPHDHADRQRRDVKQTDCLQDHGYTVIRFPHHTEWDQILARFPGVFGALR